MAKVLIFDSGVGGLTIFNEISQKLVRHSLIFVSDNAAYPYGTKSENELVERVCLILDELIDKEQPDILVIACNSASTVVLPVLRNRISIPIVGVVPAIKPAAKISKTKSIGLLATPATVQRDYTHDLINQFSQGCLVTSVGSSELVDISESYIAGDEPDMQQLTEIVSPFLDTNIRPEIDTIVLACTHFPLLRQYLDQIFLANNRAIEWVDSGAAVANRVVDLLVSDEGKVADYKAVFSKKVDFPDAFTQYLRQQNIKHIEYL